MSSETKLKSLWSGALIGIVGMSISGVSDAVCRTKLGYEQFGFVNLLKVGVITGGSSAIILFLHDKVFEKIFENQICEKEVLAK